MNNQSRKYVKTKQSRANKEKMIIFGLITIS